MSRHICVSPPLNLCKYVWQQRVKCLEMCILGRSLNFCSISSFVLPLAKWILSGVHIVNACCHLSLSCIHVALEWITNSSRVYLLCYDKMWTRLHFCNMWWATHPASCVFNLYWLWLADSSTGVLRWTNLWSRCVLCTFKVTTISPSCAPGD